MENNIRENMQDNVRNISMKEIVPKSAMERNRCQEDRGIPEREA